MQLIRALHKSEHKAAILSLPTHPWSEVVVEWAPHQYTTEIHMYNRGGVLDYQIISYTRVNEKQIRLQLGDEFYFSREWEPYKTPTPRDIANQIQSIRKQMRPRPSKSWYKPYTDSEWEALVNSI